MSHYAGEVDGDAYLLPDDALWKNTLYVGRPNIGKTNALQGALGAFIEDDAHGCMVLDAAGTLVKNVGSGLAHAIELAERSDPAKAERLRKRVKIVRFGSENDTGVRFDMVKRRTILDGRGVLRPETLKEKVDGILGIVGAQHEGTEAFGRFANAARPFVTLLVAAGDQPTNLNRMLNPRNRAYHLDVAIRAERHARDWALYDAANYLAGISQEHWWNHLTESTANLLGGFFVANRSFFGPDTFDVVEHLRSGGILLVDFRHPDERSLLLFHQFLVSQFFVAAIDRDSGNRMVLVMDELKNVKLSRFTRQMALCRNADAGVWMAYQDSGQLHQDGVDYTTTLLGIAHRIVAFSEADEKIAKAVVRRISGARLRAKYLPVVTRTTGTSDTSSLSITQTTQQSWSEADQAEEGDLVSVQRVDTQRQLASGEIEASTAIVQKVNEADPAPIARREGGSIANAATMTNGHTTTDQVSVGQERVSVEEQLADDLQDFIRNARQGWAWDIIDGHQPVRVHFRLHPANWSLPVKRSAFYTLLQRQYAEHHREEPVPAYRIIFPAFAASGQKPKKPHAATYPLTPAETLKVAESASAYAPIDVTPKPRVDRGRKPKA